MPKPETIAVKAHLRLVAPEAGGRSSGIYSGYRPNHNFGSVDGSSFDLGQVEVLTGDHIAPGASGHIEVRFVQRPGLRELLRVGTSWRLQEARTLIGTAEITEVLDEV